MGTRRTKLSLFALLLTVALTSTAYAANGFWDGADGDANWTVGDPDRDWTTVSGNDTPNAGFPDDGDSATFDGTDNTDAAVSVDVGTTGGGGVTLVGDDAGTTQVIALANGVELVLADITFNNTKTFSFTSAGASDVTLLALTAPGAVGGITVGTGVTLTVTGAADLSTAGFTLNIAGGTVIFEDNVDFTGAVITNAGTLTFDSSNNVVGVTGSAEIGATTPGPVTVVSGGNAVTFDNGLTSTTLAVSGTTATTVTGAISCTTLTNTGSGTISTTTTLTATGAISSTAGTITVGSSLDADSSISLTTASTAFTVTTTSDVDGNITVSTGNFTLADGAVLGGTTHDFTGAGTIDIGNVTFDGTTQGVTVDLATDFTGTITVNDASILTVTGALTTADALAVGTGASGSLNVTGTTIFGANVDVNEGATLDLDGTTTFTAGTLTIDDDAATTVAVSGDIDFNNATVANNNVTNAAAFDFNGAAAQDVAADSEDLGNVTVSNVTAAVDFSEATTFRNLVIDTTATVTQSANSAVTVDGVSLDVDGTLTTGTGTWTFSNTADLLIETAAALTFGGAVTVDGGAEVAVDMGDTVTITGALTVDNAGSAFGANDDAGTTTGTGATLNFSSTVTVNVAGGLVLGEGTYNFAGDLDLGATANENDVVSLPNALNDFDTVINIAAAGAIEIDFEDGAAGSGSYFWINSVVAATEISSDGNLKLAGNLDLSVSTATTVFAEGTASTLEVVEEAGTVTVTLGSSNADFGGLTVNEITTAEVTTDNSVTFTTSTGGTGTFTFDSLDIDGDSNDSVTAVGDEANNGDVSFVNTTVTVEGATNVENGATALGADSGAGGSLSFENTTTNFGGNVTVGSGVAAIANAQAATFEADQGTSGTVSSFDFANTTSFTVNAFGTLDIEDTTFTSTTTATYTITTVATAQSVDIVSSTVTAGAVNGVTISLGGSSVSLVLSDFSNYDSDGVQFPDTTTLTALNQNTFQNGQADGAHITIADNLGNATILDADGNTFDDSIESSQGTAAGSGDFVAVTVDGDARLNFRAAAAATNVFGIAPPATFELTAANAETDDGDGTAATDVTWESSLSSLTVAVPTNTPTVNYVETDDAGNTTSLATVYLFTLTADGAAIEVDSVTVNVEFSAGNATDLIQDGTTGDIVLFDDTNANGLFDSGEEVVDEDDDTAAANGDLEFGVVSNLNASIADGETATWGIAFLTASGATGTFDFEIELDVTTPTINVATADVITLGLPTTAATVDIQGSNVSVAANTENGTAGAAANYTSAATPTVLAFDVTNSAATSAVVDNVVITVTADGNTTLTDAIVEAFIGNLALFSSTDTDFDSTYDRDDTTDYGADNTTDSFFAIVSTTAFTSSVATVTFTPASNVTIANGDTSSFFLVLDPTTVAGDRSAALSAALTLSFELAESTGTGATAGVRTTGDTEDTVSVTDNDTDTSTTEITSRLWTLVSGKKSDSSCSLDPAGSTSTFAWLIALLGALSVVMVRRRRQEA